MLSKLLRAAAIAAAIFLAAGAACAQTPQCPGAPILVTSADNGVPNDNLAGVVLHFGQLYLVTYARNIGVLVNAPGADGTFVTTGSVQLRVNGKSYPASFVGPAPFFDGFQQVNIPIPPDEFPDGAEAYLRVCGLDGACVNSTGATVKK